MKIERRRTAPPPPLTTKAVAKKTTGAAAARKPTAAKRSLATDQYVSSHTAAARNGTAGRSARSRTDVLGQLQTIRSRRGSTRGVTTQRAASRPAPGRSSPQPVLRRGATGAAVTRLQRQLRAHGQQVGVDGVFGPQTQRAVRSFQGARGLAVDGVVGKNTWRALQAGSPTRPGGASGSQGAAKGLLKLGSRGAAVSTVQKQLRSKGYRVAVDGEFGPRTQAAVRAFQRRVGLGADGVVGPKTRSALQRAGGSAPVEQPPASGGGGRSVTGYSNGRPFSLKVKSIGGGFTLASKAADAFNAMKNSAARSGIHLGVNTAWRSMEHQKRLYRQLGPKWAARPGYSNHQRGLAVDLQVGSTRSSTYKWLANNADRFGFGRTVSHEPWHWEYLRGR